MQKVISLDELEQRRSEYQAQITTTGKSTYDTHHFTPAVKRCIAKLVNISMNSWKEMPNWYGMPCYASQFQFRVNFSIYSSGFAIETHQDNTIQESDGNQRKIKCGTEKGNHKAKNHRTAGTTCKWFNQWTVDHKKQRIILIVGTVQTHKFSNTFKILQVSLQ